MKRILWVWAAAIWPAWAQNGPDQVQDEALTRIVFGSCNMHDKVQPLWDPILACKPDLWIWTGDIIYGDSEDAAILRRKYDVQKAKPRYQALLRATSVIGVWDDHDYGLNNGGREHRRREDSQRALLDFLDEPADSPRRRRQGVYASYQYGPLDRRVKVLLLDTRYHREQPGPQADILGEAQWRWLEGQLRDSDARVHILVSSVQVIAEDHRYEKWADFPKARARLLSMIEKWSVPGVVFISGDRHIAEISALRPSPVGHPLYDVTSSGMTHSWRDFKGEKNRWRVGEAYAELNFGLIEIDWAANPARITLEVRGGDNRTKISGSFELADLGK